MREAELKFEKCCQCEPACTFRHNYAVRERCHDAFCFARELRDLARHEALAGHRAPLRLGQLVAYQSIPDPSLGPHAAQRMQVYHLEWINTRYIPPYWWARARAVDTDSGYEVGARVDLFEEIT